jgi:hypothetical protein
MICANNMRFRSPGRWHSHLFVSLLCALLFAIIPVKSLAIGEARSEDGDYSIEAIGMGRLTGAYMHFPNEPILYPNGDDGLAAMVLRLILEGDLGSFVDYEANFFTDISRVPPLGLQGAFATAGSTQSRYRYEHLSWRYWEDGAIEGQMGLDRFVFDINADPMTISMGRMPINYSVTNIFTPNDFFAPFSVTAINTIYKPGVDALRVTVATGMLSTIEISGVLGYDDAVPAWGQSAVIAHLRTVVLDYEWALLGGKLAQRWVVGASAQGAAGPVGIRFEGHVGFPDIEGNFELDDIDGDEREEDGIHTRLALGLDVPFEWHNASIGMDYMYISDGSSNPEEYVERAGQMFPDDLMYLGRHYLGVSLGGELVPILTLGMMGLINLEDASGLGSVMLIYSIADEADAVIGIMVPWGELPDVGISPSGELLLDMQSEMGASPITAFLETRFYF